MNRLADLNFEKPEEITPPLPGYAAGSGNKIPRRTFSGTLTLSRHPAPADAPWYPAWSAKLNIPLFWTDGARNLWQITCQTAFELGESSDEQLKAKYEELLSYFTFLEEQGYICW